MSRFERLDGIQFFGLTMSKELLFFQSIFFILWQISRVTMLWITLRTFSQTLIVNVARSIVKVTCWTYFQDSWTVTCIYILGYSVALTPLRCEQAGGACNRAICSPRAWFFFFLLYRRFIPDHFTITGIILIFRSWKILKKLIAHNLCIEKKESVP